MINLIISMLTILIIYMKLFFILLFFAPFFCNAQKLVLIDRNFHHPIDIADTITLEQASKGILPIYNKDVSSVIEAVESLVDYTGKINERESFVKKTGNSECIVTTEKEGRLNTYTIVLNTDTGNFKTSILLVDSETNKRATQRLSIFLDYLKNNSAALN
jgi:hypothetical protein